MPNTGRSFGAPVCSRCGTRADARRGYSPVCLSCGNPLPVQANTLNGTERKSGAGAAIAIFGGLGLLLVGVTVAGLVMARGSGEKTPPPTSSGPQLALGSTSASASASTGPAPLTDAERDQLNGSYTCSMDDTPAFPCHISGGQLEKQGGSQRFKGPVTKLPNGNIEFSGTFFCPFGACTHPVATTFIRQGPGRYVGRFGPNSIPGGGPGNERVVLTKVGR